MLPCFHLDYFKKELLIDIFYILQKSPLNFIQDNMQHHPLCYQVSYKREILNLEICFFKLIGEDCYKISRQLNLYFLLHKENYNCGYSYIIFHQKMSTFLVGLK